MAIPSPDEPASAGMQQVSAGQMVRYSVVVRNSGAVEAPVTVKLTVPANVVTGLQAEDGAVVANAVAWKNVFGAGQTWTYSVARRVDDRPSGRGVAVTACVHERISAPAVACATDSNELPEAEGDSTPWLAWLGSILFGILAVIGAVWLYRKVNPPPLTPATALDAASLETGSSQTGSLETASSDTASSQTASSEAGSLDTAASDAARMPPATPASPASQPGGAPSA